ncbi:DNA starvation/stationary phase protection protein Dps [Truepera radiovictrix]|uniref:Ferritin Dps family protein n=1 Tax=Truepera radiovictrix (strain DSM 17093 / CIP 108686 / LMG 22925 / RQ-24) TaxID=649638 RepID=D7CRK1_TRURR|nr:DNA starvation/stationary phase protection protein Dps [Truepera radiovictrix]ADI13491.1 Ferritin Dps family protein [Truepera radiovictrix DSM 17093]WMT57947.1 DNA starvation/stationary phase protection protein Dps [Truepera radiovictrix]
MTKTTQQLTFSTRIDIEEGVRKELIDILNQQLADATDLFTQTKQAHWNVKGMDFFQLHELFDDLAKRARNFADLLAERVTALGGAALGTVRMAAEATTLPEYPLETVQGHEVVDLMVERWAAYAASTRAAIRRSGELDEPTTEDLLTEISREVDESLYFLEAHVQRQ